MRPPSTLLQLNAILVLFCAAAMLFTNEADGQQDTLGLGGLPIPAEKGEIDLPSGTKLIKNKEEFKKYQHNDKTFEPCIVEFNTEGNIEVFYDDLASTKGCTVDLLVNKTDQIEFMAKVEDKEKNCVTKNFNDNLIPFIFNEANNRLAALTNGPEYGGDEFCVNKTECKKEFNDKGKCIKRTMFQIEWKRDSLNANIMAFPSQVAEPAFARVLWGNSDGAKMDVKMAVGNVPEDKPLVTITALDVQGAKSVKFPGEGNPNCNHPRKATPPPAIWKVNSGEFKDKYFVTFHFFPQNSSRVFGQPDTSPKGGPKCKGPKQLSFVFSKDFAPGILAIPKLPTTTTKTTTGSTTATEIKSTTTTTIKSTITTTKIRPTITTTKTGSKASTANKPYSATTPAPGTTKPPGLSVAAIVGIVAGAIALVVVVAVLVYCLCFRGKEEAEDEKEEEDEPAAAAEDEDVEKAGGELPAASE